MMKKYNQYELRFLQVLVPKEEYIEIISYNYAIRIEEMFWEGDGS